MSERTQRFVLTGGPGAGKTSVIAALAKRGHVTTMEAGRAIIAAHATAGLPPPWLDPVRYAQLMLEHDIAEYDRTAAQCGHAFFDRGIPDLLGYLELVGQPIPANITKATSNYRYETTVFLFPPWQEIYRQDAERHQNFDEAVRTFDRIAAAYQELGYALVEVPSAPVEDRAKFILSATIR